MTLGQRVAELRRVARISQRTLAAKAGVARVTITKLESGYQATANWETVARLAQAFGLNILEFLQGVDESSIGAAVA